MIKKAYRVSSFVLVLFFALVIGCSRSSSGFAESITSEQRFILRSIDGQMVALDQLLAENKVVLLNFWATWCPYCQREIPELIDLQNRYRSQGFTVVGIDIGESVSKTKAYAESKGMNYPVLLDADNSVASSFGVVGVPTNCLVRSDGKILSVFNTLNSRSIREIEKAVQ